MMAIVAANGGRFEGDGMNKQDCLIALFQNRCRSWLIPFLRLPWKRSSGVGVADTAKIHL